MHLTVHSDTLYAATGDWGTPPFAQGAQVWRTDGVGWTNVVTQGFGTISDTAIICLEGINGYLYAGTWSDTDPGATVAQFHRRFRLVAGADYRRLRQLEQ